MLLLVMQVPANKAIVVMAVLTGEKCSCCQFGNGMNIVENILLNFILIGVYEINKIVLLKFSFI